MAYTQHRPHCALAGRRFGSFASKTSTAGSAHPVGKIVQHRPSDAFAGRRYGSFSGKTASVVVTEIVPQPLGELSHAWRLDPGWSAIWGPTQYGIPSANRDDVIIGGSTGAVVYIRPQAIAGAVPFAKQTGATSYIAIRALTGLLTSATVEPEQDLANLRKLFPRQSQKVVNADGSMAIEWYRFFDYLVNTFLGGPDAPSMADVIAEIERQLAAGQALEARTLAIAQQAQANAESLSAAVQVIQNNALTGADQIPAPQTTMEA